MLFFKVIHIKKSQYYIPVSVKKSVI